MAVADHRLKSAAARISGDTKYFRWAQITSTIRGDVFRVTSENRVDVACHDFLKVFLEPSDDRAATRAAHATDRSALVPGRASLTVAPLELEPE